jgi:hypothetical protein
LKIENAIARGKERLLGLSVSAIVMSHDDEMGAPTAIVRV